METLEAIRRRIKSTEDLESVVSTMKALSTVHIRQYERAVESLRRYQRTIDLGLKVVLQSRRIEFSRIPSARSTGQTRRKTGVIVFASDYGLCGRFNAAIVTHALEDLDRRRVAPSDRVVAVVGARGASALRARGQPTEHEFPCPSSVNGIEAGVRHLLPVIDAWNSEAEFERVLLVYHEHDSQSEIHPRTVQLLPIDPSRFRRLAEEPWPSRRIPTFTMNAGQLFSDLLRQFFSISLIRAFAESSASEHASRLHSMQAASRNIEEKLEELHSQHHRQRQNSITAELLDIVSGYEVLSEPGDRL